MDLVSAGEGQLAAFLQRVERLSLDDLTRLSMPRGDDEDRVAARRRVTDAAADAGLGELTERALAASGELVISAFASHQLEPTWAGLQWSRSLGTASDRANLVAAVEDAALAVVASDVADPDDVTQLAQPFDDLASLKAAYPDLALPGALASRNRLGLVGIAVLLGIALLIGAVSLAGGAFPG